MTCHTSPCMVAPPLVHQHRYVYITEDQVSSCINLILSCLCDVKFASSDSRRDHPTSTGLSHPLQHHVRTGPLHCTFWYVHWLLHASSGTCKKGSDWALSKVLGRLLWMNCYPEQHSHCKCMSSDAFIWSA